MLRIFYCYYLKPVLAKLKFNEKKTDSNMLKSVFL